MLWERYKDLNLLRKLGMCVQIRLRREKQRA